MNLIKNTPRCPARVRAIVCTFVLALMGYSDFSLAETSPYFLGNWGGDRNSLAEHGFEVEFVASTDIMALVDGGIDPGVETPANFDLVFNFDTDSAGWWRNGSFLVYFLGNSGGDPSVRVGDFQVASNIEAANTFKLFEAYYEHRFLDDRYSLLIGLHDLNSEFYVLEHAGLFLHSSFGIGFEVSQVGPSIFSTTALTARVRAGWWNNGYFIAAIYDGVPGDPDDPIGTQISFDDGDGIFTIGEIGISSDNADIYYKLGFGTWFHTAKFEDVSGRSRTSNHGFYFIAERDIWRHKEGRGLGVFAQLGIADSDRNQVGIYAGAGLTWTGLFATRPEDMAGIAVAHARNGSAFRRHNPETERGETALELSYQLAATPWLDIQPDIQYIIDPGANPNLDNALILGVRFQLSF